MVRYALYKVKEGKLDTLKEWSLDLQKRLPEALETMRQENVRREVFRLFKHQNNWFAVGLQELSGEHKKADMSVELNRKHAEVLKECLEGLVGEVLYDFNA